MLHGVEGAIKRYFGAQSHFIFIPNSQNGSPNEMVFKINTYCTVSTHGIQISSLGLLDQKALISINIIHSFNQTK